jgi:hypothetical protein
VLVLLLIFVSFSLFFIVLQGFIMAVTRSQARSRLRKGMAIRHASQIRVHALVMEARGRLSFSESVIMSILCFYHRHWNDGCAICDCEAIYEHVMNLGVVDVMAAILATNGVGSAGAA